MDKPTINPWNWWTKGLSGLIMIGKELYEVYGVSPPPADENLAALEKFLGKRYSISDNFVITDHVRNLISKDGGKNWYALGS